MEAVPYGEVPGSLKVNLIRFRNQYEPGLYKRTITPEIRKSIDAQHLDLDALRRVLNKDGSGKRFGRLRRPIWLRPIPTDPDSCYGKNPGGDSERARSLGEYARAKPVKISARVISEADARCVLRP